MPFVLYDDQFPSHPKVAEVKAHDRAALALHLLCSTWSANTAQPGYVSVAATIEQAGSKARATRWAKILVDAELWHAPGHDCKRCPQITTGYVIHDWTDYNPDADEVARRREEISRKRAAAGRKGAAVRWGKPDTAGGNSHMAGMANATDASGKAMAPDSPRPRPRPLYGAQVANHPQDRNAHAPDDDDRNSKIEQRIIDALYEHTGRYVTAEWATRVRHQLLDGRDIANPLAYIAACIRGAPSEFMPGPTSGRNELADLPEYAPLGQRDNTDANTRGRAAVEAAIRASREQPPTDTAEAS